MYEKQRFLFDVNIVYMPPDNRKLTFITWPGTVNCDPQLSNLHHAVGYSKDRDLQIKRFHELYQSKKE